MGTITYDSDYYAWTQDQAKLLREGKLSELDINHLAEEIEDMGRSEKRELENRLAVLLAHLLKWQFQPNLRSRSWSLTIKEQRRKLARHLKDNPSLKSILDNSILESYGDAVIDAERETGLSDCPETCPFSRDQIFNPDWLPD